MRLYMDSPLVVEVVSVGKLALVGSKRKYNASHTHFEGTIVRFTLEYKPQTQADRYPLAGLWIYPLARQYQICRLLNEAESWMASDKETEVIDFCWFVPAPLRNPRGLLHWVATNMVKELTDINRIANQEFDEAFRRA